MGNQHTKTDTYQQYYDSLRQNTPVDMSSVNPYEVLGVAKNHTWEELVNAYRRLAKLVHPDKGGSEMLFNTVTECFKLLAHEFKRKEAEKPHHVLKQEFMQREERGNGSSVPPLARDGNFTDKFNQLFEENKIEDEDNKIGYGHLMAASSKTREDIEIPKVMSGKFSEKKFNEAFEKSAPLSKEVVVYKEPEPLVLTKKLQFTELGGTTDDFSTDTSKKANLQYTDYMKAHTTTRLVDPRAVQKRKEYRSIEDFEADRAKKTQAALTPEEMRRQKEVEEAEKKREEERLMRVQQRDRIASEHYERVNQLFIGIR
jgi:curved DNA-binding protein CbpA